MAIASFPSAIKESFGKRLRTERKKHPEHTQEYCAKMVGVTRRQWIHWEFGEMYPGFDSIKGIRKLYPNLEM